MKIEQLSIDGFGQFFNWEFGPFDTPLTVIAGPNEAGKSTLVAFIINVLFGFQQRDDALHIPALAGGKHGGRLSIIDDAGNRYVIQRHAGPGRSQGHIVVTREDASPAEDGVLTRLLSAATPDLFRSAFAFDLEQLQSLRAADNTDISAAIYGAGLGVKNLSQTIAKFDDRMAKIFKPRARGEVQDIEKIRSNLETIDQQLLAISKNADKYDALLARREQAGIEGEAITQRISALRDEQRKIERVQQGWAEWVRLATLDEQLANLPVIENFPEDALARLEKAETEVRAAQVEYDTAEQHLSNLLEHIVTLPQDDAVFAHDEAITYLREYRTTVAVTISDLPGQRAQVDQEYTQQEAIFRELGAGWSEERALSFDVSIPVRNTVQQHKQTLQQDEQTWRTAKETETTRTADLKESERKVQELTDTAATPPPANTAGLRLRRRMLTTLREQWTQVVTLRQNLERAVAAANALHPSSVAGQSTSVPQQWGRARDDIQRHRQLLEAAEQRVRLAAATVVPRQSDLEEAEADAERARGAAAGLPRPPLNADTIRERQRLLTQARRLDGELATRRDVLQSEEEHLTNLRLRSHEGGAEGRRATIPPVLVYGLALAGIAGIAAGVVLGGDTLWPGVGAGVVLLVVAVVLYFVSSSKPSASALFYDPVAQQQQRLKAAGERVTAAEAQLREALRPLGIATQASLNLDAVEQELTAAQTTLATWNEAQALSRRAEDEVVRRRRAHEIALRGQEQAEQGRTEALRGWGNWLVGQRLDPAATTERVLDFVGAWERAEAARTTATEAEAKLADLGRSSARNGTVDQAVLDTEEQAIDEAEGALREWEQRQAATRAATDDAASKRRLLESAADTVAQAAAKLAADQDAWAGWLQTVGLDASYQPDTVLEIMHKLDAVRDRHTVILQRRQAVEQSESSITRYRDILTTAISLLGESSPGATHADLLVAVDNLLARYDAAVTTRNHRTQAETEAERAAQERQRRAHDLKRTRAGLAELLQMGGAADVEAFRRRAREQSERAETERARAECLLHLQTLSGPEPAWSAYREELRTTKPDTIPERLQQVIDERAALEKQRNASLEERGSIDLAVKQLEGDVSASELRAQRADLIEQLQSHAREWAAMAVAKRLMEQARQTYEREAQPAVIREARSFFSAITAGQYDNIYIPLEQTGGRQRTEIWATQPSGNRKAPRELSRGTREQLYLSLRFGLIRNLGEQQERLPVIVDDVLVNFDPDRAARAAKAFAQLAETHQVLVFTCHPTTAEHFLAAAPHARIINLEGRDAPLPVPAGAPLE